MSRLLSEPPDWLLVTSLQFDWVDTTRVVIVLKGSGKCLWKFNRFKQPIIIMYFDTNNDDDVNEGEYHVPAIRNNNVNDEADENYNYINDTDQYGNEARARRPYALLQRNSPSPPPIPQSFAQAQKKKKRQKRKTGKKIFFGRTITFTICVTSGRRSRYSTTLTTSTTTITRSEVLQWIEFGIVCPQWSSIHCLRRKTSSRRWMVWGPIITTRQKVESSKESGTDTESVCVQG